MSTSQHYFSEHPSSPETRRTVSVRLAGVERQVTTANDIFSPDGIDKGTSALLKAAPQPAATGRFLDIGSGWGPLALTLGLESPKAEVFAVEVNQRAAALCRDNAEALDVNLQVMHPDQVPAELMFDLIWSNPPIRIGKKALHELLQKWLPRLAPAGEAWLVVQKNLGADSLIPWIQRMLDEASAGSGEYSVHKATSIKGFRIIQVIRAADDGVSE